MKLNPYQSPPAAETLSGSKASIPLITDRLDAQQRSMLLIGLEIASWGHSIVLASMVAFGLPCFFYPSDLFANKEQGGEIVMLSAGGGLMFILIGIMCWCMLSGREKTFAILALILQSLAMIATGSFLNAAFNGRFVGGLFLLFGASSFSMLLISQAIVALLTRSWAASFRDRVAVHASELAVFGYAVCASVCAANSMQMLPKRGEMTTTIVVAFVSGIAALALQLVAYHRTLRSFRSIAANGERKREE